MMIALLLAAQLELGAPRPLADVELVPAAATNAKVVAGNDGFLVLWQRNVASWSYQLLDRNGHPRLAQSQPVGPSVEGAAFDGRDYLLAAGKEGAIQLQRIDGETGASSELPPIPVPLFARPVTLASDGNGFLLIAAESLKPASLGISLDRNGTPISALFPLPASRLIAAAPGDGYLLLDDPFGLTRITSFGSIARSVFEPAGTLLPQQVLFDGVQFVLFTTDSSGVFANTVDRDGRRLPRRTVIATKASLIEATPSAALIRTSRGSEAVPLGFGGTPLAAPRLLPLPAAHAASLPSGDTLFVSHAPLLGAVLSPLLFDGPRPTPLAMEAVSQNDPRLVSLGDGQVAFWSEGTNVYATRIRDGEPLDGRGLLVAQNVTAWRVASDDAGRAMLAWQETNSGTASIFTRSLTMDALPSPPLLVVSNAGTRDALLLAGAARSAVLWARNGRTFLSVADAGARELVTGDPVRYADAPLELIATGDGYLAVLRRTERLLGGSSGTRDFTIVVSLDRAGAPRGSAQYLDGGFGTAVKAVTTPDGGAAILYDTSNLPRLALLDARGNLRASTTTYVSDVFATSQSILAADATHLWRVNPDASLTPLFTFPTPVTVAIATGAVVQSSAVDGQPTRLFLRTLEE